MVRKKKRLGAKSLDEKYWGSEPVLADDYLLSCAGCMSMALNFNQHR